MPVSTGIRDQSDPRSIDGVHGWDLGAATLFPGRVLQATMDQGSVLVVRVFGSLSIYFTPQIESISNIILDNPIVK